MAYIERALERKFLKMNDFFKVVLVTGARQVGKTTMLKRLAEGQNRTYVSLDDMMARTIAQTEPELFFQTYKPPMIIDEVQYAPQLFTRIKILCDSGDARGAFWLTGSQQFQMMKNVRESLAGRIGTLELYSLTKREIDGVHFSHELDFSFDTLHARQRTAKPTDITDVFRHIWRGGMPQLVGADAEQRQEYFSSYVNTYLMRDAAELGGIANVSAFGKFLTACASLVGEQVSYKTLAEAADISEPTSKMWLRLLEGMGIICLLRPYANNALKRLSKTPKLYFLDTGLAAYLSMWLSPETLMNGAASGHFFENYVFTELLKHYAYAKTKANLSYYRDSNAKEIDIFVERGTSVHPLEIKKSANPDRREVKKFDVLAKAGAERGAGGILCMCERVTPISATDSFIPVNLI
ncbi:MAG: ATP-binding protein [Oscillospiraceae bacterium]|jgi:predicted AAA+ superfamily ATPase|nr:ATP-binding protein [Oscillospiraceae bacterium]